MSGISSALEEFSNFFQSGVRGPLAEELEAAQRDVILSRTVLLIWISVFAMPLTCWGYVYFVAPEQMSVAVPVVLGATAAVLFHRLMILRGAFDRRHHLAMALLVGGVYGPLGSAIVEITRASPGDAFFAFFVIYFAFTSLFPAEARWVVATSSAIIASYLGARLFRPDGLVVDAQLVSHMIYLGLLSFIALVFNRLVSKLFFDEKRMRIELAHANEGLRELDKAKTGFFSNISHEIRTPLTLILTPLTHILRTRRDALPPDVIERMNGMRANAARLLKMVNSILDFAKLEAGQTKVTVVSLDAGEVVDYVASLFSAAAEEKGIRLVVERDQSALWIQSDLDKLEKILINLVANALKYTPDGGTITMSVDPSDDHVELRVKDTGIGISKEHHRMVFQRFARIEGTSSFGTQGTGIGLTLVQEYARLLGGYVTLDSSIGLGSTFVVRLPIAGPAIAESSSKVERSAFQSSSGEQALPWLEQELAVADVVRDAPLPKEDIVKAGPDRPWLLIVDDNPGLLSLIASILESDYNLCLASTGAEALERLDRSPVSIDLVISDVMMPGISGLELCKRIKAGEKTQHVPVVLLTARGALVQKVEGLKHGADDYIGKPFDPEELRARIESLFELRRTTRRLAEKSAQLEEAMERLKAEEMKVVESEKLRTLGELAAGIFHELHNYMNMIQNGAAPLREGLDDVASGDRASTVDYAELRDLADVILTAAQAARTVTAELKGFAHHSTAVPAATDVHATLHTAIRLFGRRSQSQQLELDLDSTPVIVDCVPGRLIQVFTNLIKNAFDAMGARGKVIVRSRVEGGQAVLSISDTGPGVSEAARERLFEPFHTTKRQGEGLGLGLSLSRKVLQDLGGDLRLDASYTEGARFVLTMPLSRVGSGGWAPASVTAPAPPS